MTENNKPTHYAYKIREYRKGNEVKKAYTRIGTVWPHENGQGFNLQINEGLSVHGKITCFVPKDKPETDHTGDDDIPFDGAN